MNLSPFGYSIAQVKNVSHSGYGRTLLSLVPSQLGSLVNEATRILGKPFIIVCDQLQYQWTRNYIILSKEDVG